MGRIVDTFSGNEYLLVTDPKGDHWTVRSCPAGVTNQPPWFGSWIRRAIELAAYWRGTRDDWSVRVHRGREYDAVVAQVRVGSRDAAAKVARQVARTLRQTRQVEFPPPSEMIRLV